MKLKTAIAKINKNGVLLVFPITNKKEPNSLWSEFYPRTKMRWEWDESGDNRVADMWRLMKRLSSCREVVYSKWYQGRATFFSREFFSALLCLMNGEHNTPLSRPAQTILETLEMDSPLSTKQIKAATDLQGRYNEPVYGKAMKELFPDCSSSVSAKSKTAPFLPWPSELLKYSTKIYSCRLKKCRFKMQRRLSINPCPQARRS